MTRKSRLENLYKEVSTETTERPGPTHGVPTQSEVRPDIFDVIHKVGLP